MTIEDEQDTLTQSRHTGRWMLNKKTNRWICSAQDIPIEHFIIEQTKKAPNKKKEIEPGNRTSIKASFFFTPKMAQYQDGFVGMFGSWSTMKGRSQA